MVAICDHNTAGNAAAVQEAAGGALAVIAGIEVTTEEEVHVLGLFPDAAAARTVGDEVRATLPDQEASAGKFGRQLLMDAEGRILGVEGKMLVAASAFDLAEAVELIRKHGGLAIAAHVNRPSFSVIAQLGMFPPDVRFDAIEISALVPISSVADQIESVKLPILIGSDSHDLSDVGSSRTEFEVAEADFAELSLALRGTGGRRCVCA
jgi:PHP family Zn ribbon phosphoesterase